MREDTNHRLYTDKLEVHILELPKLKNHEYPENRASELGKIHECREAGGF